jgi:hypothetical protein
MSGAKAIGLKERAQGLARWWNHCWFERFDPVSLGAFRIFLGSLIAVFYLALYPNWERYYAADGITSLGQFANPDDAWTLFHWTESSLPIGVFWWLGLGAALSFALGWKTWWCTALLFALESSLLNRSLPAMNGEDVAFRMLFFWGLFAPLGHRLSLDSYVKRRRGQGGRRELPTIWATRAMQVNFALIYAISLPHKLVDDVSWLNGDALYYAIANDMWRRWPWPESFYLFGGILSILFTYGTLVVEAAFVLLVWFSRFRLYVIGAVAALHLGIAFMLKGATFFTLVMVCGLWIFVPNELTQRMAGWLAGRCRRQGGHPKSA